MKRFGVDWMLQNRFGIVGGGGASALPLNYLLNDEFTTDEAAPLASPRTAEPGPGAWTAVENDGSMAISGSELIFTAQSTPFIGDLGLYMSGGVSVVDGLGTHISVNYSTRVGSSPISFMDSADVNYAVSGGERWGFSTAITSLYIMQSNASAIQIAAISESTDYELIVILNSSRNCYVIKGGAFIDWSLVWVDYSTLPATVFPAISNTDSNFTADNARAAVLSAFADASFLTDSIATPAAGNTFIHEADGWLTFDLDTLPTSTFILVSFRRQDSNNYWNALINSVGTFVLQEVIAGTPTNRASETSVVTNGMKIRVVFVGSTITGYYNNTQAWAYTGATNFQTETDGQIIQLGGGPGAISDLETLPLNPSGTHLSQLNQIAAGT